MKYELSMFLSPKMTDEVAEKKTKELDKILERFSASVLESNFLGMKDLAYPIKHFKQGYYFIIKIEAEPNQIKIIKNKVYNNLGVIRLLVTKQEKDVKLEANEKKVEEKKTKVIDEKTERKDERVVNKVEVKKEEIKETDLDKKLDEILEEEIVD